MFLRFKSQMMNFGSHDVQTASLGNILGSALQTYNSSNVVLQNKLRPDASSSKLNSILRPKIPVDEEDQEQVLVDDLLFCLLGATKGNFIQAAAPDGVNLKFQVVERGSTTSAWKPALLHLVDRILPICDAFLVIQEFLEENFLAPIGRNATPAEMGDPLIFLNSHAARFISGENLVVDYGYVASTEVGQRPSFL